MRDTFSIDHFGRQNIASQYGLCDSCRQLTLLCSYATWRFLSLRGFPLIPLGKKVHIYNECSHCGHRHIICHRKYRRQRKVDLAGMMEGFTSDPDNPDIALNGLHTLMVYNAETWFLDCTHSYGRRFETHMQIQLKIAEGLCRFGHYEDAATFCRKAIVLGAGPSAEELLELCMTRLEKKKAGQLDLNMPPPESMLRPYAFIIAVAAITVLGFTASGVSAMRNHSIWLVSGSPLPYVVEIDGKNHELDPYETKRITVRLGEHRMQVHGLPGTGAPTAFTYKTSLLRQKIDDHALVLNPDSMALLVEETLVDKGTTNHYLFGKIVHQLKGIDYPFSGFPVWAGSKRSTQTRLTNRKPETHIEMVEFLLLEGHATDARKYARRALRIEPDASDASALLPVAVEGQTVEQSLAFLRKGTATYPLLLEWHHFYQNLMTIQRPDYDLKAEYAALCKTHPEQSLLYYLLGRVVSNSHVAHRLHEKSEAGAGSRGLGYHAIAFDLLCTGQARQAQPYVEKALQRDPDNPDFKKLDREIHLALHEYEPLLEDALVRFGEEPDSNEWIAEVVKYQTLLGRHQDASETMHNSPDTTGRRTAYCYAARYYAVGNAADYLECLIASGVQDRQLEILLYREDVAAAHDLLGQNEDHDYSAHLILYCAAMHHGCPEIAEMEIGKALAKIPIDTPARKKAHSYLAAETPPAYKEVLALRIEPCEKALLCATLGHRFPNKQDRFFKLARKFNYTPKHPQLLLKKWIRGDSPR